jgi:hypothetical protein
MTIIAPERFVSIVNKDGTPSLRFAEFCEELTRQVNFNEIISGTGSPEGVVTASPKKLYMDDSGTAGNILYIKKTGTGNTGWILV